MLTKLPDDAVILAFGDSLTYGTGASAEHDYPHILAQLSGREVINAGVPGEISGEGRQRLPALLDEYQPSLLILIHGGNDFLRKLPVDQTRENLKAMIAEAKQRNIAVVLLGVPQFGLMFLHSADIYAELAESEKIPTDLETLPEIIASNDLKSDAVHPNNQGYQRLAESIAALLKKQGAL
ncbi:arylesterase [Methylomonas rapida]|uniref:Arylesterase n=1 Tax=Methylomonas rapida TaxID=2963939 RepID=A0ABY7GKF6_9GAMM|nr:arylesterase [Methylomonas rapida]WAR44981.1 arylesterase [Methylomonas rapida]